MMTHDEFARDVIRTINRTLTEDQHVLCATIGIAGEAGELLDYMKKYFFQGHAYDREKITDELGDILFYITYLSETLCINIEGVMEYNVAKRAKRYPNGFDVERSINR